MLTWPPPYVLKVSQRARHVRFKVSHAKGLEVTVPYRFNQARLLAVLEENRAWIEKQAVTIQYFIKHAPAEHLPSTIHLEAIQQIWQVHYTQDEQKPRLIKQTENELLIAGKTSHPKLCQSLLKNWLKLQAKQVLSERLRAVSQELALPYHKLSVKLQTTRWGSCSYDKNISLNAKLLFLSPAVVRSVMIHELCHTVHLNHSQDFWQLVAKFEPKWREYNVSLRHAVALIPDWVA